MSGLSHFNWWRRFSASATFCKREAVRGMPCACEGEEAILLPAERLDHMLSGDWDGHRECHIGGDFLLVYKLEDAKEGMVVFSRCGTHSEIFG